MDHVTLIVVPDERSPVRRVQVPRALIRWGPWVAAGLLALFAVLLVDWVRLRIDTLDLAGLRAKAEQDQSELAGLSAALEQLETKLERLSEFERKVRVIADLPAALPDTHVPAEVGAHAKALPGEGGQGGEEEEDVPGAPVSAAPTPEPAAARDELGLDRAVLLRIRSRAAALDTSIEARGGAFEQLVEKLRDVRDRLAATPSIWPADGFVTSGFGWRLSPFTGRRHFHAGLDIAADTGTDIVAAARGRVAFAGPKGAFGQAVILDHGFGVRTLYGHTSAIHVKAGQAVERGQRIASVGNTGRSTGPHLHYTVQLKGRSVNPADYVLD
ncbi:MAG TPA: M23 family metallopeptidase [Myxococcota bacterium]|nr:M23 family metallopeptidase [Myxococcota bacterium]